MGRRGVLVACVRSAATFLFGFAIGAIFNLLLSSTMSLPPRRASSLTQSRWETEQEKAPPELWGLGSEETTTSVIQPHPGEVSEPPRILCYVLTGPDTHKTAIHVKNTWGQRCDRIVFYSTKKDANLMPEVVEVPEGYGFLWAKTKAALAHLHRHHPHYHWYLKADDDTYVIVENLRYFLRDRDPDLPVHYGVKFRQHVKQGYMSGGGGYVLSREALRRFVTEALQMEDQAKCATNSSRGAEDLHLGLCLESVGVAAGDSLDEVGRPRFFSHSPLSLFFHQPIINKLHWYWRYIWYPHVVGPDCCSRHTITFHDIDPRMMWTMEMLLYRLHVHRDLQPPRLNTSTSTLPPPPSSATTTNYPSPTTSTNLSTSSKAT